MREFFEKRSNRLKFFKEALSKDSTIDPALMEDYQLTAFNLVESGFIKRSDFHPQLGILTCFYKSKTPDYCRMIEETFEVYEWKSVFGYTLEEVKDLPFPEWLRLREILHQRKEKKLEDQKKEEKINQQKSVPYHILMVLNEYLPILAEQQSILTGHPIKRKKGNQKWTPT